MVSILKLGNPKPTVKKVLSTSCLSPKNGAKLADRGVIFSDFGDWIKLASQALVASPYSFFWRRLALQYPENMIIEDFSLFFQIFNERPILSEQAMALLFSLPAEKLPLAPEFYSLPVTNQKEMRVKMLLARKKEWGDDLFYQEMFKRIVDDREDDQICFPLENGETITRQSHIFSYFSSCLREKRMRTIFGPATFVCADRGRNSEGIFIYVLPDAGTAVKKISMLDYDKIDLDRSLSLAQLP